MPYVKNGDINIYYEVEGQGLPLVMLHPFTGSLNDARRLGYVEALKDQYQIVLIDLIGHGKSDKPHNPEAYTVEEYCGDIIAVLDDIHVSSANLMGWSGGGLHCLVFASQVKERAKSLTLIGAGSQPVGIDQLRPRFAGGAEEYMAIMEQSGPMPEYRKAQILANDFDAFNAILNSPSVELDFTNQLSDMTMPFLILFGENDQFYSPQKEKDRFSVVSDLTFIVLPGIDHFGSFTRIEMTLPHIREFLTKVNE